MSLYSDLLAERERRGRPVRVAVIGAGKFGGGLLVQLAQTPGMEAAVAADLDPRAGAPGARLLRAGGAGGRGRDSETAVADAVRSGRCAVTGDPLLAAACPEVDVVVEATGAPEAGARHALAAIEAGRHVVMVNVEADVTVGALLRRRADAAGVVYTLVDGDQPGCIMDMVEWARTLGFEIVAAGRGTVRYADDAAGTPDSVQDRYGFDDDLMERRTINTKMFNSFRDGTKAQVEMTALANMTGLPPDVRGMHEPSVNVEEIPRRFSLREEGGLLGRSGVVELANSVAARRTHACCPTRWARACSASSAPSTPSSARTWPATTATPGGRAATSCSGGPTTSWPSRRPCPSPAPPSTSGPQARPSTCRPVADTVTVAKRDLPAGEVLDGGGGYTVNGVIETAEAGPAPKGCCPSACRRGPG